jgi:hypothetical protein
MPVNPSLPTNIIWTNSTQTPSPVDGFEFYLSRLADNTYTIRFIPPRDGQILIYAQTSGHRTAENCGASMRLFFNGFELMRVRDGSLQPPTDGTFQWENAHDFNTYNLRCSPAPDSYPNDIAFFSKLAKGNIKARIDLEYWNKNAETTGFLFRVDYVPD